jgi:peptide-methionine (R)-S-oxide reductase
MSNRIIAAVVAVLVVAVLVVAVSRSEFVSGRYETAVVTPAKTAPDRTTIEPAAEAAKQPAPNSATLAAASETASEKPTAPPSDDVFDGAKIVKTEAEWKKVLTPEQYHIMREEGTERAYSGKYAETHEDGEFYCAACGLHLFSSKTKFESGTGWPSFYAPFNKKNVTEIEDRSLSEVRTEVECARCGGHLGHVFDDGPKPTGLRYCMNSASLVFKKAK